MATTQMRDYLAKSMMIARTSTPDELTATMRAEERVYQPLVERLGLRMVN